MLRQLSQFFGRWPIALAACFVLAAIILLPGLGSSGLWDPQERMLADRIAPPDGVPEPELPPTRARPADDDCERTAPPDHIARSLTNRSIRFGRDYLADSDTGRRLPLALLGLFTVLAAAGTAMRTGGARAGVAAAVVLLAMPLLVMQSRMLTSEIGTACGSALIVYALVAFAFPYRKLLVLDLVCSSVVLLAGIFLGFLGGGALHGLVVPIGAVAAAGSLGVPFFVEAIRRRPSASHLPALIATVVVLCLLGLLAYQTYNLVTPYPGLTPPPARQILGKAVVPEGCWSWALGATWRPEDDLRYVFDSTFEQIAYGTFPWGVLAPIAMFALLRSDDAKRQMIGAVTLAWAGGAWIAAETFQRKSGFTVYAAFPALAIAIGVWLDDVIVRRARMRDPLGPAAAILIALFVALAVIDFGKDLQSFTDKLTSLLAGSEVIAYPKDARLLVPVKLWLLVLGGLGAVSFAVGLAVWRSGEDAAARTARLVASIAIAAAIGIAIVTSAFWSFVWQPTLGEHLSSKAMLETYNRLRSEANPEPLYVMGDLGHAPKFYSNTAPQLLPSREQIVAKLKQKERVFAIAPQSELCTLHREMGDQHRYFVLYANNTRSLLFSNQLGDAEDENPLSDMIVHKPPAVKHKPKGRVVWDNKIELIGWDMPDNVRAGDSFEIVTYFKILGPVGGAWTMLLHFDGPLRMRDGDHKPIKDRCPTSTWMQGDYIIDRHTMHTSGNPSARYELWVGFFTGTAPNFRNMDISAAPGDMTDTNDRVRIGSIILD